MKVHILDVVCAKIWKKIKRDNELSRRAVRWACLKETE